MGDGAAEPIPPDGAEPTAQTVGASLAPIIKDLPEPKQREIVRTIEQQFMAVVRRDLSAPHIDPETAKIVSETIQKDNDNKFKYLTQKQADAAAQAERHDKLQSDVHYGIVRPVVWAVILITLISVAAGVYFIANGREAVGSSILTGVFGTILGFLGGLGTASHVNK